jgi:Metallo-beta-lactamase superfamily
MKIAPRVFLAASGTLGISLTHDNDCNVYAVRCGSKYLLIDCGVGLQPETIAQNLAADGVRPGDIERLLLTHYHLDHCGGAHWFRENFGAAVAGSAVTAVLIPCPRCVMTTLSQGDLPLDSGILRTVARQNNVMIASLGQAINRAGTGSTRCLVEENIDAMHFEVAGETREGALPARLEVISNARSFRT